jgi:hypothetical protein
VGGSGNISPRILNLGYEMGVVSFTRQDSLATEQRGGWVVRTVGVNGEKTKCLLLPRVERRFLGYKGEVIPLQVWTGP